MFLFLLFASFHSQATAPLKNTVIAVIDTGIDTQHPALRNALWKNPGETGLDATGSDKSKNGIDDDKNGFIDDVSGWNFVSNSSDISDNHGHGTHIAGLLVADSPELRGQALGAKIMVLKYFDPQAPVSGNLMTSVRAIKYAILMGAHIINYSGGGLEPFEPEKRAIELALKSQIPVVAAAGNESTNADALGFYPASYGFDNIISVAALGRSGARVPSSNWGPQRVHLAAPGEKILSTYLNGSFAEMTGTSQATAIVTALLAQIRENSKGTNYLDWIKTLKASTEFNASLVGKISVPGNVSLQRALYMKDSDETEDPSWLSKPIL